MKKKGGMLIVFVGPDGSGKTTLINNLLELFKKNINKEVSVLHRRYGILPEIHGGTGLASMKGKIHAEHSDDKKEANLNVKRSFISKITTWFVVLYHTFDYCLGNVIVARKIRRKEIVFFDRYYYDLFLQPTMRDLIYPMRHLLLAFVRRPNLVIHLFASGDIVHKRKAQLSEAEIDIQNKYMKRILLDCKNVETIVTDDISQDELALRVYNTICRKYLGD